jgi:hypothetical protein
MRQGLQVAGEPMKHITWTLAGLALAAAAAGCGRPGPHAPQAAVDACGSTRALLAVRREAFHQASGQGAPQDLLGRLRREGRAALEDPEVEAYDRDSGVVTCTALFRLQPPAPGAEEISSDVTYEATPLGGGAWRYRLTDPGQVVEAIASLGPLPPEAPPASSAASDAAAAAPGSDAETLQDAAAAGDTGRVHPPAPTPAPAPKPAPAAPAPPVSAPH